MIWKFGIPLVWKLDGYFYSVLYIVTNVPILEQEVSPTIKYFLTFYIRLPVESQRLMIDFKCQKVTM